MVGGPLEFVQGKQTRDFAKGVAGTVSLSFFPVFCFRYLVFFPFSSVSSDSFRFIFHRVLQGAAQKGAQFDFILWFSGPFFRAAK